MAPLAIVIPAPINHAYWRQLMKGDYIDIISNCPYEMHNSLSDEDYSKIIYELKEDHKELIYFLYLRDFTTGQLAALRNQSDRNIRGVRSTILGQIEKKVYNTDPATFGFKPKHNLLPYPGTEIRLNPNITQNPGW